MASAASAALAGWHEFFALAGAASAALVGLLFVAAIAVHFSSVLATSLIMLLPAGVHNAGTSPCG